jgi:hypothetical protein
MNNAPPSGRRQQQAYDIAFDYISRVAALVPWSKYWRHHRYVWPDQSGEQRVNFTGHTCSDAHTAAGRPLYWFHQSTGLKFDGQSTIDICRLLRIPGTFNFKDHAQNSTKPPLPVTSDRWFRPNGEGGEGEGNEYKDEDGEVESVDVETQGDTLMSVFQPQGARNAAHRRKRK